MTAYDDFVDIPLGQQNRKIDKAEPVYAKVSPRGDRITLSLSPVLVAEMALPSPHIRVSWSAPRGAVRVAHDPLSGYQLFTEPHGKLAPGNAALPRRSCLRFAIPDGVRPSRERVAVKCELRGQAIVVTLPAEWTRGLSPDSAATPQRHVSITERTPEYPPTPDYSDPRSVNAPLAATAAPQAPAPAAGDPSSPRPRASTPATPQAAPADARALTLGDVIDRAVLDAKRFDETTALRAQEPAPAFDPRPAVDRVREEYQAELRAKHAGTPRAAVVTPPATQRAAATTKKPPDGRSVAGRALRQLGRDALPTIDSGPRADDAAPAPARRDEPAYGRVTPPRKTAAATNAATLAAFSRKKAEEARLRSAGRQCVSVPGEPEPGRSALDQGYRPGSGLVGVRT